MDDVAAKIRELAMGCLLGAHSTFESAEAERAADPEVAIEVRAITAVFVFRRTAIEAKREEIRKILNMMDNHFHVGEGGGGGWSFLNLCIDASGRQWGEHREMETLCVLAIAAGLGRWTFPRALWSAMPGGMPYITFDTAKAAVNS